MNRETILSSIQRHLRDHRDESVAVRSLGEVVRRVATDVRRDQQHAANGDATTTSVIPIQIVAAFIDGTLSSEETAAVCDAVLNDNSVLAELVAAVRGKQELIQAPPELSTELRNRLLAQAPIVIPPPAEPQFDPIDEPTSIERRREPRSPEAYVIATLIVATAATVLAILYSRRSLEPQKPLEQEIAIAPAATPEMAPHTTAEPDALVTQEPQLEETPLVNRQPMPTISPSESAMDAPVLAPEERQRTMPESVVVDAKQDSPLPKPTPPSVSPMRDLEWTRVSGLVALQTVVAAAADYRQRDNWTSVSESSRAFTEDNSSQIISVFALPLSRAEAELGSGGRFVLSGDTAVEMSTTDAGASMVINVLHGMLALVDLPAGSVIRVQVGGQDVLRLRFETEASAVIEYSPSGLQTQAHGGTVTVENDVAPETLKRMPTWIDRAVDNVGVPRTILAQISQSPSLVPELNARSVALARQAQRSRSESRILATLGVWQAALAGENLPRLMNVPEAEIRNAAVVRLVELPPWDPRYASTWDGVDRALQGPRQTQQIQQICEQLQVGVPADAVQIDLLLMGLESPVLARRAICDYLLRRFNHGGPPFDPSWTGQEQQRGVALWQRTLGRATGLRGAAN